MTTFTNEQVAIYIAFFASTMNTALSFEDRADLIYQWLESKKNKETIEDKLDIKAGDLYLRDCTCMADNMTVYTNIGSLECEICHKPFVKH